MLIGWFYSIFCELCNDSTMPIVLTAFEMKISRTIALVQKYVFVYKFETMRIPCVLRLFFIRPNNQRVSTVFVDLAKVQPWGRVHVDVLSRDGTDLSRVVEEVWDLWEEFA